MRLFTASFFLLMSGGMAMAQPLSLQDYLSSMDKTEVTFKGRIKFEESTLSGNDFTYYNAQGKPFPVTVDAGRKSRERIQNECENSSYSVSLKDICKIEGEGTIEIRGSRIHLSIDTMTLLTK